MELRSSPKSFGQRSVAPEETIQRLEAQLAPRFDYVIHEETVAPHCYWTALFVDDLAFRSMGKGTTQAASRAGALAEAAEWLLCRDTDAVPGYRCEHQDDLPVDEILPIEDLLQHVATATPPVLASVKNLDESRHWVPGTSLSAGRELLVPIEYVNIISGPNGQAAGNTLEEAIEHAILEVFERRVHIAILRNRMVLPTIDQSTITDPLLQELLGFIRDKGIEITIKDLSFDGVMPCVGAYFMDPSIPEEYQFRQFFKVGSSFDTVEALTRTCTEFIQGRMRNEFLRDGNVDLNTLLTPDFRGIKSPLGICDNFLSAFMFGFAVWRDAGFLREGDVVPFEPSRGYSDSLEDIRAAQRVCESLGKDMVVVDISDPDTDFYVARVIVPSYSDALPFHPAGSPGLFRQLTRSEVLSAPEYRAS
jgi:YcaO-like protein with predicted kinase domain